MKLIEKYKDKIANLKDKDYIRSGFCWVNEDYKEILLEDINCLSFNSLYPNIIVGLYDSGYIDKKESSNIERIRYFLENKETIKEIEIYKREKLFTNSYFGILYKKYKEYEADSANMVIKLLYLFYLDFIKDNKDSIVYINVDEIFYKGNVNVDIGIGFIIENVDYLQVNAKGKYISYVEGELKLRGYRTPVKDATQGSFAYRNDVIVGDIKNKIISRIRERKLNKILN
jgi:hypothetical protein